MQIPCYVLCIKNNAQFYSGGFKRGLRKPLEYMVIYNILDVKCNWKFILGRQYIERFMFLLPAFLPLSYYELEIEF